jgi:hypothetical protein
MRSATRPVSTAAFNRSAIMAALSITAFATMLHKPTTNVPNRGKARPRAPRPRVGLCCPVAVAARSAAARRAARRADERGCRPASACGPDRSARYLRSVEPRVTPAGSEVMSSGRKPQPMPRWYGLVPPAHRRAHVEAAGLPVAAVHARFEHRHLHAEGGQLFAQALAPRLDRQ